jgi:hypothetical protein
MDIFNNRLLTLVGADTKNGSAVGVTENKNKKLVLFTWSIFGAGNKKDVFPFT